RRLVGARRAEVVGARRVGPSENRHARHLLCGVFAGQSATGQLLEIDKVSDSTHCAELVLVPNDCRSRLRTVPFDAALTNPTSSHAPLAAEVGNVALNVTELPDTTIPPLESTCCRPPVENSLTSAVCPADAAVVPDPTASRAFELFHAVAVCPVASFHRFSIPAVRNRFGSLSTTSYGSDSPAWYFSTRARPSSTYAPTA